VNVQTYTPLQNWTIREHDHWHIDGRTVTFMRVYAVNRLINCSRRSARCWLFIVALCNRADHYILPCDFFLPLFFPRLISAVANWTSTHGVALVRI